MLCHLTRSVRRTTGHLIPWAGCTLLIACGGGGGGDSSGFATDFSVGGRVSGLSGTGLVLTDNGGDDLAISADGSFTFSTRIAANGAYSVAVKTQPSATPAQRCTVTGGSGLVGSTNVTSVSVNCHTAVGKFLYVANRNSNSVAAFRITATTGALAAIPGSPFATGASGPMYVYAHPSGKYLYVIGFGTSAATIEGFAIDEATGALAALPAASLSVPSAGVEGAFTADRSGTALALALPSMGVFSCAIDAATGAISSGGTGYGFGAGGVAITGLVFDASAAFLYLANGTSVNVYLVDATTRALTPAAVPSVTPAIVSAGPGRPTLALGLNPQGSRLYVTTGDVAPAVPVAAGNAISAFNTDPIAGLGTEVGTAVAAGPYPIQLAFDRGGTHLYASNLGLSANSGAAGFGPGSVSAYDVDTATGALTEMPGSPFATGGGFSVGIAISATGKHAVVTNAFVPPLTAAGSVAVFGVDAASGALAAVAGSPFGIAANGGPSVVSLDPSGQFAYVADGQNNTVASYAIDAVTGAPTLVGSALSSGGTQGGNLAAPAIAGLQ